MDEPRLDARMRNTRSARVLRDEKGPPLHFREAWYLFRMKLVDETLRYSTKDPEIVISFFHFSRFLPILTKQASTLLYHAVSSGPTFGSKPTDSAPTSRFSVKVSTTK